LLLLWGRALQVLAWERSLAEQPELPYWYLTIVRIRPGICMQSQPESGKWFVVPALF
jgi:hypothetical protein